MNDNATLSVNLTMLMIVSVCLPMIGAFDAPAELEMEPARSETPPSPCLGHDACRGSDAGNDHATAINLTGDFAFDGEETNVYWGSTPNVTGYSSGATSDDHNDVYLIDMQPGYGYTVEVNWNISGASMEQYAYAVAIGPGDGSMSWIAWGGSGSWGRSYYAASGHLAMSSDGDTSYTDGYTYWYDVGDGEPPIDIMGESVLAWVWCYYCYYTGVAQEYQMNITIWPADGGVKGDTTTTQYSQLLSMPDDPASWSYQSDTFDLDGNTDASVVITSCDSWCTSESSVDITKPDGTQDTFNLANFFTGEIASYSDAGTYTVEKIDTYGDGGFGLTVGSLLGNFSGLLSVDDYVFEDAISGHVDQTDSSDIYAIYLPENYKANLTLHWESSADLDLQLYTDYDEATGLSGMFDYSWFDQPEYIDIGQLGDATTIFAEIVHYSGPAAGYILELQTEPGAPPPCFFQDDGHAPGAGSFTGGGADASDGAYSPDDDPIDVSGHMDADGNGVFSGMVCAGYDDVDWYKVTVPAYHGMWAMLEWPTGFDSVFNDTIEGDISFAQYMITPTGYQYSVSSSYGFHPQAVATNESYYWNTYLTEDSDVYLRLTVNDMTEDYESNYTIHFSVYNATVEPYESVYQNDAGQAIDAGDGYLDSLNLTTMNQTFDGYGHDSWDTYDYYKVYVPTNYAMEVCVSFPAQNDVDLNLFAVHPTYGYMMFVDSSYNDNPECAYAQYDDANQDIWIRIHTDRGSGPYTVSVGLLTPGLAPGDAQDDCGTGLDANEAYWTMGYSSWFFVNDSDQADLNPYDANGSVRSYWEGGTCTGWLDGTWDPEDIVDIAVPNGHYVSINTTIQDEAEAFWEVYIVMSPAQHLPASGSNGYYFAGAQCTGYATGGTFECEQDSGLWPVGVNTINGNPGWITLFMRSFSAQNATWSLDIGFHDLSTLEGGSQNDANSGLDAGSTVYTTVHANDFMNQTQTDLLANNSTLNFEGWNHGGIDTTDRFTFDVPINHGVFVEMECYDCDGYMVLDFYDSSGAYVGYGGATFAGYLSYNTSSYVTSLPSTLGVGVRNWFGYDDDGDDYYLNISFYSLDADGDGWLDQDEWDCGTDPNDPTSFPTDTDGDGICDANDEDIDGDGIGNDLDEMPFDENQSADMDGDGDPDSTDPDRDGDGWDNVAELICLGAASNADYDANITPSDYDGDGLCDTVADSDVDHVLADTYLDPDGDDDGTNDEDDAFAFDECADTDTDRDGMPDDIFGGLDGDGNHDWANAVPGVDHDGDGEYDNLVDADGDGAYGSSNDDADGDGLTNFQEAAVYGGYTWSVSDYCHPGTPSGLTEDTDDDNDGHLDEYEIDCGSSPTEAADMPQDSTIHADLGGWSNGLCDALDPDDDNDGYNDTEDVWPFDHTEWADADGDLQGDNRDMDDDNDGWWDSCDLQDWLDAQDAAVVEGVNYFTGEANGVSSTCPAMADAFPMDGTEWIDTDGDTIGDNADADDDGDTWTDAEEDACGTDSLDASSIPLDSDDDGTCDVTDTDDDGDGIDDAFDAFPLDVSETADLDGNGIGDNLDPDDDGDGWFDDVEQSCFTDPLDSFSVPTDFDGDGTCDEQDNDDDGDGVDDDLDAFPYDTMETNDHDGDGIGDLADSDDDNDGWYDYAELACLSAGGAGDKNNANEYPNDFDVDGVCDAVDPDDDNDGFPDPACVGSASTTEYVDCAVGDEDRFPRDSAEWYDANEDGLGDNGAPVTLIDNIKYDPVPYVGIVGVIGAMGYGLLQMSQRAGLGGDEDDAEDYTEEFEDFDFEDDDQEED